MPGNKKQKEIIVCVCAGISAYKACELVRLFVKKAYGVSVLMTKEAEHFIGPLTFQTLSRRPVATDMFAPSVEWDPRHIALAERADAIVVVPATANIIAKLALGICDDIITCVIAAAKAKVIICPAMNENMYNHKPVRTNIARLKEFGYTLVAPVKGELACGKTGMGHLAAVETIFTAVEKALRA